MTSSSGMLLLIADNIDTSLAETASSERVERQGPRSLRFLPFVLVNHMLLGFFPLQTC